MASFELIDLPKPADYYQNQRRYKPITVVVLSDTQNKHDELAIPDGDILLHCGDFTNKHDWHNSTNLSINESTLAVNDWLGTLPHRHKIVICGNHERGFKGLTKKEIQSRALTNCHYLDDELIEVEGISIYGCSWSFFRHQPLKWSSIPANIDILMTHIPPRYILNLAYQPEEDVSTEPCARCKNTIHGEYGHWGSRSLIKEIRGRIGPKVHCFGHVHDSCGYKYSRRGAGTMFINAAADLSKKCYKFTFYVDLQ